MAAAGASCHQVSRLLLESHRAGRVEEAVAAACGSREGRRGAATEDAAWQARRELALVAR